MSTGDIEVKVRKELEQGTIVTFEYENVSRSEVPIMPKLKRIRFDLRWEDVIHDRARESNQLPIDGIINNH